MEFHGLKIDFVAVGGIISALASLLLALKGSDKYKRGEENDKDETKNGPAT